jgi:amidase
MLALTVTVAASIAQSQTPVAKSPPDWRQPSDERAREGWITARYDALVAAAAVDLADPATAAQYRSDLETGRAEARAWIDGLLANGGEPVDAILSPTANTAEVGARAGYPQITVPAGYDPIRRRPVNVAFTGSAGDDARLIGFAHAYERAAGVRRTPSQVNPATWHCVAPIAYVPRTCPP